MTARPTDEEIAELKRLLLGGDGTSFSQWQSALAMAAYRYFPVLLALVTQEGGGVIEPKSEYPFASDKFEEQNPLARSSDAPEQPTDDDDTGYDAVGVRFDRKSPAPLPEGMETTDKQRAGWKGNPYPHGAEYYLAQASRDIDRLTAALAEANTARWQAEMRLAVSEQRAREDEREAILGIVRGAILNVDAQAVLIQAIVARARSTP